MSQGEIVDVGELTSRERYHLLTSLVVPRPIGWISTRNPEGGSNLAPFSFYTALSSSPMLVGVSIGLRDGRPKDTLRNIRATGEFCVNVVGESHLEAMNQTAAALDPHVDEADEAGLDLSPGSRVSAPFVADAAAALECTLFKDVDLEGAPVSFLVGQVRVAHLSGELEFVPGTRYVEPESFRPVGRLHGRSYGLLGEIRNLRRPE